MVGHNYWAILFIACCYGATLAGYVPLTALVPSLSPENKGAAMSVLNLGSGLSAFVGPLVVTAFIGPLGVGGVMHLCWFVFLWCIVNSFPYYSKRK